MANRKKADEDKATENVVFRVTPPIRRTIRELTRRRAEKTGDTREVGWFVETVLTVARECGIDPHALVDESDEKPKAKATSNKKGHKK